MRIRLVLYAVTALCLLVGTFFLLDAVSTYRSFSVEEPSAQIRRPPSSPAVLPVRPKTDRTAILRRNLFGEASTSAPARPAAPPGLLKPAGMPSAPSDKLQFRLVGTTFFGDGGGYAILEDIPSREQFVHRQGENVRGTLIQEVQPGSARLVTGNREDILYVFNGENDPSKTGTSRFPVSRGGGLPAGAGQGPQPPMRYLPRAILEKGFSAGGDLAKQVQLEKYRIAEGGEGVLIVNLASNALMTVMGFRGGDVILSVNGKPANEPADFLRQMSTMPSMSPVEIEVLRAGRRTKISFQIRG